MSPNKLISNKVVPLVAVFAIVVEILRDFVQIPSQMKHSERTCSTFLTICSEGGIQVRVLKGYHGLDGIFRNHCTAADGQALEAHEGGSGRYSISFIPEGHVGRGSKEVCIYLGVMIAIVSVNLDRRMVGRICLPI